MKLWVDDERPAPEGWVWVTRPAEAIRALATGTVTDLSLDHDLGIDPETNEPQTTRPIVLWLCEMDAAHTRRRYWPDQVRVHSQNPVGRQWLEAMIDRYKPSDDDDDESEQR